MLLVVCRLKGDDDDDDGGCVWLFHAPAAFYEPNRVTSAGILLHDPTSGNRDGSRRMGEQRKPTLKQGRMCEPRSRRRVKEGGRREKVKIIRMDSQADRQDRTGVDDHQRPNFSLFGPRRLVSDAGTSALEPAKPLLQKNLVKAAGQPERVERFGSNLVRVASGFDQERPTNPVSRVWSKLTYKTSSYMRCL